jgi:glucosylglycerate synthase
MTAQELEAIGKADVAIGIVPPSADSAALFECLQRICQTPLDLSVAVIHPPLSAPYAASLAAHSKFTSIEEPRLAQDRSAMAQSIGQSFRVIFAIAEKLDTRACVLISSDPSSVTPEWITHLVGPIIHDEMDLVTPCYAGGPYDGLINRAIVYPLMRSLYGRSVRNPMGPDFGLSHKLLARMSNTARPRLHPLVSLVAESIATEMKICQVHLGPRVYSPVDWTNLGPYVSQVLAAIFLDVERFAPWWQRARGSEPMPEFGCVSFAPPGERPFNPEVLMQRFQIGARGLIETWGTVLPPSTLVALRRLAQQNVEGFRMRDETWARIVYDYALAHRIRPANRDQILRSFTPIYLGWAASYALEVEKASPGAVEHRMEELCLAFETDKPYLVSRWRWPDRFNP